MMTFKGLQILWLPVLTTIPQSQEVSRAFQQLNNDVSYLPQSGGVRVVRNLNNILPSETNVVASGRALCSYCR